MAKKSLAGICIIFLVLLVAQEVVVQAKTLLPCENLSRTYRGACFFSVSCDNHCKNKEHDLSGRCRDDYRCWCNRKCNKEAVVPSKTWYCEMVSSTYRGPCFTDGSCDDHCKNKEHDEYVLGGECGDDYRCRCILC